MSEQRTAVLLVAAGLSTRMGGFKPLIDLGGKPLIDHALDTFLTVEICEMAIVTGHRHEEIRAHLSGRGIHFIHNENYATTDMLNSVKRGLSYLSGKCGRVFIMPADIPLVRPFTARSMLLCAKDGEADVVKPAYRGKSGHPLLVDAACIPQILAYTGDNGLKGALKNAGFDIRLLPLPDPGMLMDADTPQNLAAIQSYYRYMDTPSRELALEILAWREAGDDIVSHCIEVEKLAAGLARRARMSGFTVDVSRTRASALLHDVEKRSGRDHAQKGSALLMDMGYCGIADIVGAHMQLPEGALEQMDERAIVYLADKLTCGVKRVSVESRLKKALALFGADEEAVRAAKKRMSDAQAVLNRLGLKDAECL